MHRFDAVARQVADECAAFVEARLRAGAPLGATATPAALRERLGVTITPAGLGAAEAFVRFRDVVVPATVGLDSPRFLAFIPAAPTTVSVLFDAVVSACTFSGESWLEAAGAVHAENEVLRFLADLAGLPATAGGCFVSGGSAGNLSALAVARDTYPAGRGSRRAVVADTAHSSVANALALLGMEAVIVPTGEDGRLRGDAVAAVDAPGVCAVVASAGSTNAGVVDALDEVAAVCTARGWWMHVDGAYGAAALLVESVRSRFAGIEATDSLIVDPHKWLYGPLDCCALVYRRPELARAVHTQRAAYLDVLHTDGDGEDLNPADHAFHLTRRARGLPVWFSLAVHGTAAYAAAIGRGLELARETAERIRASGPPVELVTEPELSVVLFRRHGWTADDWVAWSRGLLADGVAFVTPTRWKGEPVGRLVFLHPATDLAVVDEILRRLR
ncbi:MAG TPA: aminotransferase class V-fold PLP-dependent enzyme [Acidimicrobiales bacterium]|nr:aminotransferase class V-fold PLP-dependent enzyme [Acidimicrobiales bacterium]